MSYYNLHNFLPYQPNQNVFVLVGSTITEGVCVANHVSGNSYTYDVQFPGSTGTTNYPQSQVFNTNGNAQIAYQQSISPTPTLSPTNTPTSTVTPSPSPTPSLTPSYTGPQYSSNLLSASPTSIGGTVTVSNNNYTYTSTGGNPCFLINSGGSLQAYRNYKLKIRYEQMTGKNAFVIAAPQVVTQGLNAQNEDQQFLPPINVFQQVASEAGAVGVYLDGSGYVETIIQTDASATLGVLTYFYDDANFKLPMADGKVFSLTMELLEIMPDVSLTPTISVTPSVTPSITVTISQTPTDTPAPSRSPQPSVTPSGTPRPTGTPTPTVSPTVTVSASITPTPNSN
jgi:hypothetical protein